MEGIFVTGTDTEVGKTTVSAGLTKMLYGARKVAYWKPIQTGTVIGDDTEDVKSLAELNPDSLLSPVYRFPEAVAPYLAAKQWNQEISLEKILDYRRENQKGRFLVVEGAGGLLVPLTAEILQIELIQQLGYPVVVIAPSRLGTINHTLLTLEVLRHHKIPIAGVILTLCMGGVHKGNVTCIRDFGKVEILAEFEKMPDRRSLVGKVTAHAGLRKFFDLKEIPS